MRKSERIDWCKFLNNGGQVALLVAVSIVATGYPVRPAYARTMGKALVATARNAAGVTNSAIPSAPQRGDMTQSEAWAKLNLSKATELPISFVLADKPIRGIPKEWHPRETKHRLDENRSETDFEGTDPKPDSTFASSASSITIFQWWNGWLGSTIKARMPRRSFATFRPWTEHFQERSRRSIRTTAISTVRKAIPPR